MRIISGDLKGQKISLPSDSNTRPLKDLVKESIFNIIKHSNKFSISIEGATILDLFSGVGSFGIEALSRKAKEVTFVENYPKVLEILESNLNKLKLREKSKILKKDIFENKFYEELKKEFNLIFIDAPFKEKKINLIINNIKKNNLLKKDGIIILHRQTSTEDDLGSTFNVIEYKKYGISKIIFGNYF
jgi:16S rRNA (guanine966-N2)-methyltransferase